MFGERLESFKANKKIFHFFGLILVEITNLKTNIYEIDEKTVKLVEKTVFYLFFLLFIHLTLCGN